jgi:hypothetical protein
MDTLTKAQEAELKSLVNSMDAQQRVIVHANEDALPTIQRELLMKGLIYYQRPLRAVDQCCLCITSTAIEYFNRQISTDSLNQLDSVNNTSKIESAGNRLKLFADIAEKIIRLTKLIVEIFVNTIK